MTKNCNGFHFRHNIWRKLRRSILHCYGLTGKRELSQNCDRIFEICDGITRYKLKLCQILWQVGHKPSQNGKRLWWITTGPSQSLRLFFWLPTPASNVEAQWNSSFDISLRLPSLLFTPNHPAAHPHHLFHKIDHWRAREGEFSVWWRGCRIPVEELQQWLDLGGSIVHLVPRSLAVSYTHLTLPTNREV